MSDSNIASSRQILSSHQTGQKIRRIAFEIYEHNFEETGIIIAGIAGEGYAFAKRLSTELLAISPLDVQVVELRFDKHIHFQCPIIFDREINVENKVVIVADDVLNTGRTLAFALEPFLKVTMKKVQVAVVVDRGHHLFPIHADYVGYSLSTTLTEHVEVILSNADEEGVYLR
ncbi:phosphoribosyltransferase family protein [Dyadobacter arcticus]|uniref:Pyrimidine operon attenuation protein/uracil phosphoribosyltransferase n=1 Tax=Dyadobacter arcticus TaxID=1078754 RepID=A0ABX0UF63_9BACT|nr:phosphoribosyltransferase family protein [Dyadobacter arcticus]NIJ51631.1 pyrimidine operon attenuation protein/uracil phosphoribosyltransferase [Dyadobacter arcticus]